jgi:hypothetical protein
MEAEHRHAAKTKAKAKNSGEGGKNLAKLGSYMEVDFVAVTPPSAA